MLGKAVGDDCTFRGGVWNMPQLRKAEDRLLARVALLGRLAGSSSTISGSMLLSCTNLVQSCPLSQRCALGDKHITRRIVSKTCFFGQRS
eukprot:4970739-Amphidinium_carterae.1